MKVIPSILAVLCFLFVHCYSSPDCTDDADSKRFDCYPDSGATEDKCEGRGCCWKEASQLSNAYEFRIKVPLNVPYCFYPKNFGYKLVNKQETDTGFLLDLQMQQKGPYGGDIGNLKVDVRLETEYRVHVKVFFFFYGMNSPVNMSIVYVLQLVLFSDTF